MEEAGEHSLVTTRYAGWWSEYQASDIISSSGLADILLSFSYAGCTTGVQELLMDSLVGKANLNSIKV